MVTGWIVKFPGATDWGKTAGSAVILTVPGTSVVVADEKSDTG